MSVRLFDISHHNATADLATAKAAGYAGVHLKATQGASYTDPTFAERRALAKQVGLPCGAYLFLEPDQPVADQVARFVDVVGNDLELRVALDHETESARGAAAAAAAARNAAALLARHYGYAPLLYTYRTFQGLDGLDGFPLWLADYTPSGSFGHVPAPWGSGQGTGPHVPAPWTEVAMWQIGQAKVPGVSGGDGPGTDVSVAVSLDRVRAPARPAPTPGRDPLLKLGSRGPRVTDVQHALDGLDPRNLTAHTDGLGRFGARTQQILRTFQRHRNLPATGTTTPLTWAALRKAAHPDQK